MFRPSLLALLIAFAGTAVPAMAAFQANPEGTITPPLQSDPKAKADCGEKPKLEALSAEADADAAKKNAVSGLVQMGQLPADKVQTPPTQKPIIAPQAMETCK